MTGRQPQPRIESVTNSMIGQKQSEGFFWVIPSKKLTSNLMQFLRFLTPLLWLIMLHWPC